MVNNIPLTDYDKDIEKLINEYKKAVVKISNELERIDVSDLSRAHSMAVLSEVGNILVELDASTKVWIEEYFPLVILEGAASAMVALELVGSMEEAKKVVKFNKFNKELVEIMVADTQTDLLAVTQNVNKKVRIAVRQVFSESLRSNYAAGINGRRTINRETLMGLRKTLGDAVNTGIIDSAGRRWKPEDYVDMITRTKMMNAYNEAHTNEAVSRNAFHGVISSHGATDACRYHEGRIVKLTPEAPGDYPTIDELKASGQIFHPRCKHSFSAIRSVDLLPESVKEKADKQSELGTKALATGKRNPVLV